MITAEKAGTIQETVTQKYDTKKGVAIDPTCINIGGLERT